MPAYVIVTRQGPLRDQAAYDEYVRIGSENRVANNMNVKVLYGAIQPLEGKAPDGVVILEFPSMDEAKAWYDSPEYQAAVPHRIASGDWSAMIVEGV
jgi:uncharacterized protein (DUF1330 family)